MNRLVTKKNIGNNELYLLFNFNYEIPQIIGLLSKTIALVLQNFGIFFGIFENILI
jgi:hypothetical protein